MDIKTYVHQQPNAICKVALAEFLEKYLDPAFGALPKKEIDLMVMQILEDLNYISTDPSLYDLVTKLKVTRTKARNLIYDKELRRLDETQLDERVKIALRRPILQKQGDLFILEIENPLVADHLRAKVKHLGYATDTSFSPSLIRFSLDAVTALFANYLSASDQKKVKAALIKAGAPDDTFKGVLKSAFKALAKKYAQESGEALVENISGHVSPLIEGAVDTIIEKFSEVFKPSDRE